jgi:HAD superfamily hydrolase (TIGR01484 family)
MRFLALATDYDGTIATGGRIGEPTFAALQRLRQAGRKVLLVTGREIDDLARVCPRLEAFDLIVAENGGLLYFPESKREVALAPPPPSEFIETLKTRRVSPLSVGRVIVATWQPHENVVLETIRDLGLELQVIFNKGAVMVLPSGVNKATGLAAALKELGLSPHNVVAVGDAENDHALCKACEAGAAVANALPALKEAVDLVLENHHGAGVEELIDKMLADDLRSIESRLARRHLLLGASTDGFEIRLPPYGSNLLVTGTRGGGKSSLAFAFLERLANGGYQYCLVDPDGSYREIEHATSVGHSQRSLDLAAVVQLLQKPAQNTVVDLRSVAVAERSSVFLALVAHLERLRATSGHPHWLIVDDADHLLPSGMPPESLVLPAELDRVALITESPRKLSSVVLAKVNTLAVVGEHPERTIGEFCEAVGRPAPMVPQEPLAVGDVLYWRLDSAMGPLRMRVKSADVPASRDIDSAAGDLGVERSFFFRGPQGKLNLRAGNLEMFVQLAEGLDEETWLYHLQRHDYSSWLAMGLGDARLASKVRDVEQDKRLSAVASRAEVRKLIEEHYRLPTGATNGRM